MKKMIKDLMSIILIIVIGIIKLIGVFAFSFLIILAIIKLAIKLAEKIGWL